MSTQIGVVSEIQYVPMGDGMQCEVRVFVDDRDTNWLPKLSIVSGSHKVHVPPRVGDQVIIHNPNSKNEDGYVTDNIAYEKVPHHKEIGEDKLVVWSEDGTTYIHDLKEKIINLTTPCDMKVTAPKIIFDAEVEITKNLVVGGTISDIAGSLTTHTHLGKVGPVPLLRVSKK